jgi:hypothetical protein
MGMLTWCVLLSQIVNIVCIIIIIIIIIADPNTRSTAEIVGSNPAGTWISVSSECRVLSR